MLALKKWTDAERRNASETTELLQEQNRVFCSSARTLLYLLKSFTLDVSDLDAGGFKKRIDRLVELVEKSESPKDWHRALENDNSFLLGHSDRQKEYLKARESELKGVIEFMHNSLLEVIGEGSEFTGNMHERNIQLERIAGLDDIRKIKDGLKAEMHQMKQAILDKESKDARRVETLSREVGSLKSDLEKAKQDSMTDKLTGANNRLSFDGYISRRLERYVVSRERFSLLLCDLDDFKKINDTYGHQEGDSVLRTFVHECRSLIRDGDFIARYGGEEFAIVLPGAPLKQALKRAQTVCTKLASNRYLSECQGKSCLLTFTTSIGVAEVRQNDTVETLIDRADKALYMAKRTGKNRAVPESSLGG